MGTLSGLTHQPPLALIQQPEQIRYLTGLLGQLFIVDILDADLCFESCRPEKLASAFHRLGILDVKMACPGITVSGISQQAKGVFASLSSSFGTGLRQLTVSTPVSRIILLCEVLTGGTPAPHVDSMLHESGSLIGSQQARPLTHIGPPTDYHAMQLLSAHRRADKPQFVRVWVPPMLTVG